MAADLDEVLARHGEAVSRTQLIAAVGRSQFDSLVRRGHLVAVFPRIYARPWQLDSPRVRQVAAIRYGGPTTLLSHLTALDVYGLAAFANHECLHVTSNAPRHPRGVPARLSVHRTIAPLIPTQVSGLPCVPLASALVQSWPFMAGAHRRAPLLTAIRQRLLTPAHVRRASGPWPKLAGRAALFDLLGLLEAGCESELELWGYRQVFNTAEFRTGRWQLPISVGRLQYRVDLGFEAERLAVELDGRTYHSSPEQWQRDINRDLALATLGWQTIRLSHARLTGDVLGCRRDVARVLRARQANRPAA